MFEVIDRDFSEYDNFVKCQENGAIQQSSAWSAVKNMWEFHAFAIRNDEGSIVCSMGILIRKLPIIKYRLAYAPRGPVYSGQGESKLNELFRGVMEYCRKRKCCSLICDPYIRKGSGGFEEIALKSGFKGYQSKSDFTNIQPQYIYELDIRGKSEEQLLQSFESKTRYNIGLAKRKGVTVSVCDASHLDDFYRLMIVTGARDNFKIRPKAYFAKLLTALGENARLYIAFADATAIAGTIAINFGSKVTYQYGASDNKSRNLMPNYLLQWEMIKWGIETKASTYDFGGVAGDCDESNPLYGLYRFKKGFNGELVELTGEYRYDFIPCLYSCAIKGQALYKKLLRFREKISGAKQ